jgi:hypothetical protein
MLMPGPAMSARLSRSSTRAWIDSPKIVGSRTVVRWRSDARSSATSGEAISTRRKPGGVTSGSDFSSAGVPTISNFERCI